MPYVISCPTCRNPLSVGESQAAYVVTCPACKYPLTVPAVVASHPAPESEPFDLSERPRGVGAKRGRRPRGGISPRLVCIGFALVAIAVSMILAIVYSGRKGEDQRQTDENRAQTDEVVEALILSHRASVADEEYVFWATNGLGADQLQPLKREADGLVTSFKVADAKLETRWGDKRKGLNKLDPKRYELYEQLVGNMRHAVNVTLDANLKGLKLEEEVMEASIRARFPITLPERIPDEDERLYDARVRVAKAQREVDRAKQVVVEQPILQQKWFKKSRAENRQHLESMVDAIRPSGRNTK